MYQLGVVAFCLVVASAAEMAGLGMEVGAFIGGLMISSTGLGPQISERIEANRNLFSALFLSSLGMLMHASFLWRHLTTLLTFLALLVAFKAIVTGVVLWLCGYPGPVAWATAIATAQIGEFSFVLLAKAKNVGYANRGYCHNFVQEKHSYKHRSTHIYIHIYIYHTTKCF